MSDLRELRDTYLTMVRGLAVEGNVLPVPVSVRLEGGGPHHFMCTDARSLERVVRTALAQSDAAELAFGVDRFTKDGQGTTRGNVLTYALLRRGQDAVIGIVEYDAGDVAEPREGPEIGFWFARMRDEVSALAGEHAASWGVR